MTIRKRPPTRGSTSAVARVAVVGHMKRASRAGSSQASNTRARRISEGGVDRVERLVWHQWALVFNRLVEYSPGPNTVKEEDGRAQLRQRSDHRSSGRVTRPMARGAHRAAGAREGVLPCARRDRARTARIALGARREELPLRRASREG